MENYRTKRVYRNTNCKLEHLFEKRIYYVTLIESCTYAIAFLNVTPSLLYYGMESWTLIKYKCLVNSIRDMLLYTRITNIENTI